jgi:23S rRNA pseudouridine1911/1915/1917 synthase
MSETGGASAPSYETFTTVVDEPDADGMRADRYIAEYLNLFTRSQLKQRGLELKIDGRPAKPSKPVRHGASLEFSFLSRLSTGVEAEPLPLDILYEDREVVVVNKPQGMVVHPAAGNFSGTLVQGLLHHVSTLREQFSDQEIRPGIVHRLDKETSGVIIAAKTPGSFSFLSRQFAERTVRKSYLAEVRGRPQPAEGRVDRPITRDPRHRKRFTWTMSDGKPAQTDYAVVRSLGEESSLVRLRPHTGRTHQLRVHMTCIGHPIVGDPVYGKSPAGRRDATLMLHAYSLTLDLPGGGRRTFRAPLPERFRELLRPRAANLD